MAEHPLVERVAREMYKASPWVGHHTYEKVPWETMHPDVHADYMKQARAAIRAVLTWEPSEEAQRVGNMAAETRVIDDPCGKAGKHVWGDMADALLRDIEACVRGGDGVG